MKPIVLLAGILFGLIVPATAATYDIRDYGAVPDTTVNSAAAIQRAIDACAEAGGGTVRIPTGHFMSGILFLKSNITLELEAGAVLYASSRKADYLVEGRGQMHHLIQADSAMNIAVTGRGILHGRGEADFGVPRHPTSSPGPFRRGIVLLRHCTNVTIRDVQFRYSDMFTITMGHCENVVIDGVVIQNNYFRANSDGIDPGNCRNVTISNCHITAGDDCICFKNGGERILVTNCTLQTPSTAIKFGTSTKDVFRDILVTNCAIYNSMAGIGMYMKDGGTIQGATFSNLSIQNIVDSLSVNAGIAGQQAPIYIDIDKRNPDSPIGKVQDITFDNIRIESAQGILIQGMKVQPVERLRLRNIDFTVSGAFDYRFRKKPKGFADKRFHPHSDDRLTEFARKESYVTLANVRGLHVENIAVTVEEPVARRFPRVALGVFQVENATLENINRNGPASIDAPVVELHDSRSVLLSRCLAPEGKGPFLKIGGARTEKISLSGNDFSRRKQPVLMDEKVKSEVNHTN